MRFFKKEPEFKFMNKKFLAFIISVLIIIAGGIILKTRGFNLGIDFTGGTLVEVSYRIPISINKLRKKLAKVGLEKSIIQRIGEKENKFFIKTIKFSETSDQDLNLDEQEKFSKTIKDALLSPEEKSLLTEGKKDINNMSEKAIADYLSSKGIPEDEALESAAKITTFKNKSSTGLIVSRQELETLDLKKTVESLIEKDTFLGNFTFLSVEIVGPQVGHDLRKKVTLAAFWALLGMLIYIGFRFHFIYGLAAVITLFHDLLICLAFILFFNVELSLKVVAALLTIIGYSLNDTIVIFDRVRDNVKMMRRDNAEMILDRSINQTLSRTIVTSSTTFITVLALFFLGGEVIHTFAFTLMVGILVGTYSSIFQSCAWLKIWEKNFLGKKNK
ncbi:MAG: protein translocase subunit SecF [Candidatus Aminicenantes bacterium]|nr:protein translocase subunit SecF [Candidatus Aminicenantes bacterium]